MKFCFTIHYFETPVFNVINDDDVTNFAIAKNGNKCEAAVSLPQIVSKMFHQDTTVALINCM